MTESEYEDLEAGLSSAFWRRFMLLKEQEWGDAAFGLRVSEIVSRSADSKVNEELIRQITCARNEINKLFKRMPERFAELQRQKQAKAKEPQIVFSRRGGL